MKIQITIKTGKETDVYFVNHSKPKDWCDTIGVAIKHELGVSFTDDRDRDIYIGSEKIKNSIIEFKEVN